MYKKTSIQNETNVKIKEKELDSNYNRYFRVFYNKKKIRVWANRLTIVPSEEAWPTSIYCLCKHFFLYFFIFFVRKVHSRRSFFNFKVGNKWPSKGNRPLSSCIVHSTLAALHTLKMLWKSVGSSCD